MKYLIIEHNGNGGIEYDHIHIEDLKSEDFTELGRHTEDDLVCAIPLKYIKRALKREDSKCLVKEKRSN